VPFRFTGKLNKVTIRVQPRTLTPAEEAMLQREGQRSNRASEMTDGTSLRRSRSLQWRPRDRLA